MPRTQSASLELKTNSTLIPAEITNAYSLAMDQALGLQKRSLSAISHWNAEAIEVAWSFAPVICELCDLALRGFATYMQWTRTAWGLPAAPVESGRRQLAESTGGILIPASAAEATDEVLAHYMDIALGAEALSDPEVEVISIAAVLKAEAQLPALARPVQRIGAVEQAPETAALAMANVA